MSWASAVSRKHPSHLASSSLQELLAGGSISLVPCVLVMTSGNHDLLATWLPHHFPESARGSTAAHRLVVGEHVNRKSSAPQSLAGSSWQQELDGGVHAVAPCLLPGTDTGHKFSEPWQPPPLLLVARVSGGRESPGSSLPLRNVPH